MKGPDWIKSLGLGDRMPNHNHPALFSRESKGVQWTPLGFITPPVMGLPNELLTKRLDESFG